MVEGKGLGIGIGIGIVMGIGIGVIGLPLVDNIMSNQSNPIADILETDDAQLARLETRYNDATDRLTTTLILTNKNGDYTKANGNLELTVKKDGRTVHSEEFEFTKDDFVSWRNNNGDKVTGYQFSVNKYFSSYGHDVFVDLETKSGSIWKDLHTTFFSLN